MHAPGIGATVVALGLSALALAGQGTQGTAGHFIDPTGFTSAWGYRDGGSWAGSGTVVHQVSGPYRLRRERPRVAVLTDNLIASSGEAVVVAFRQRPDTRSFGTPTCGLSTANTQYRLSDGATLTLTISVMADRTRTKYGDSIVPDEVITDPGETLRRAIAWLTSGT